MGFFSKMMNKVGGVYIKQLVQDFVKVMMDVSMYDNQQIDNPYLTDNALDRIIEHLDTDYFERKNFRSLESKFDSVAAYWVQLRLERPLGINTPEDDLLREYIERVRPFFMKTKAGVIQKLK